MIIVTGATGNVGRELVKALVDGGAKVTAVTRDPATAVLPAGARVVGGDPASPETLSSELQGVDAIFINLAAVGAALAELLALAAKKGVQRVVLLSGLAAEFGAADDPLAGRFRMGEHVVTASGLEWTFVRAGEFAANSLAWVPQIRSAGVVRGAYADAATSPIHERDIAAVAAVALVDAAHAGHSYAITGPESITQRDKVRLIGEAIGKELSFEEIPPEMARQAMVSMGYPEPVADSLLGYQAASVEHPGPSTDTVKQILGRPALGFGEWASDHAAAFGG